MLQLAENPLLKKLLYSNSDGYLAGTVAALMTGSEYFRTYKSTELKLTKRNKLNSLLISRSCC